MAHNKTRVNITMGTIRVGEAIPIPHHGSKKNLKFVFYKLFAIYATR